MLYVLVKYVITHTIFLVFCLFDHIKDYFRKFYILLRKSRNLFHKSFTHFQTIENSRQATRLLHVLFTTSVQINNEIKAFWCNPFSTAFP